MNLPTETDPFESPEDEKSRETPSPTRERPNKTTEPTIDSKMTDSQIRNEKQPTTTNTRQSWMDDETAMFQAPAFLQDLKLPTHVKFPHKFRDGVKTLYRKHSKKLPRSVRVYRTGGTNSKDNDAETTSTGHGQVSNTNNLDQENTADLDTTPNADLNTNMQSQVNSNSKQSSKTALGTSPRSHHRSHRPKRLLLTNEQHVEDITLDFLYKPHATSALILSLFTLCYYGFSRDSENYDIWDNIYQGYKACCILFIIIGLLCFPNGPFIRPHPAIWRVVLALSILYLMTLTFALFLSVDQARMALHYLDPSLKHSIREIDMVEAYAEDCDNLSLEILYSSMDIFAFAHFTGWVGKSFLLRSFGMSWMLSVLWELTEIVFKHILPNFQECWWDSWILDVGLCNGLGIYVGIQVSKFLEVRNYKWESIKTINSLTGKLERAALQFTPHIWHPTRWIEPHSSPIRVFQLWIVVMLFLVNELNCFFFKHFLVYNSKHILNWGRILFMVLLASPAMRQYYVYVTDTTCRKMGTQCWIFIAINFMELLVNLKFGFQTFTNTHLSYITCWMLFCGVVCAIGLYTMAAMSELCQFLDEKKPKEGADGTEVVGAKGPNGEIVTRKNKLGKSTSRDSQIISSSGSSDDDDADVDSGGATSFFFKRNYRYVMDRDLTDTTDTDGDRGGYFPSAARLRQRIVSKISEFKQ